MDVAMDVIAAIRREYGLDIEIRDEQALLAVRTLTQNLENACRSLSEELYSRASHFALELIQNADDNQYGVGLQPTLKIQLQGSAVIVYCNEVGFNESNVRAICSIGRSTKVNNSGYIGEKGIGFKSVFTVADVVSICSGPYAFQFDKRQELGMVAPIWTDVPGPQQGGTSIHLELSAAMKRQELVNRLQDIQLSLLLFLRKLRRIEITIDGGTRVLEKTTNHDQATRLTRCGEGGRQDDNYILSHHEVDTYRGEEKRSNIRRSEVIFAFPVTALQEPVEREQEVHAFLPLRNYGFHFVIQADFLTAANREDILTERQWNQVLCNAIAPAAVNALLTLQSRPSLTYTWMRYVDNHVPDPFFLLAQQALISELKGTQIIESASGGRYRPADILYVPDSYRAADGQPLVPEQYVYPEYYLSSQYDFGRDGSILRILGVSEMSQETFIAGLSKMSVDGSLRSQSDVWWESVCSVLFAMFHRKRNAIRALEIVPLASGAWVSANEADVYFDSAVADIPHDLGMKLVKRLDPRSERHRLLERLELKEANYTEVARRIHSLHASKDRPRSSQALVTHAHFLFNHRYEINLTYDLSVLSKDGSVIAAEDAYMDHPVFSSPRLSDVLRSPKAHFLHADYDTHSVYTSFDSNSWKDWLRDRPGVNVAPKYTPSALSAEFIAFLTSSSTQEKLAVIRQYCETLRKLARHPAAAKTLREALVVTSDGEERSLCAAYLKRDALGRFDDLPFLPIDDPNHADWDVLIHFGVSSSVDCSFYLKQLIRLSEQATAGDTKDLLIKAKECYKQLEARFSDDDHGTAIRAAFREKRLIYIPEKHSLSVAGGGHWVSLGDAVWEGPSSMQTRYALKRIYGGFEQLFCKDLVIPSCPDDILFQEMRAVVAAHKQKPLGNVALDRVHAVLSDFYRFYHRHKASDPLPRWVGGFQDLSFLPVRLPDGTVMLRSLRDEHYLPDLTGELADLFEGRVPMVAMRNQEDFDELVHLRRLLSSTWFSGAKSLEDSVERVLVGGDGDKREPSLSLSVHYQSRVTYLRRYAARLDDPAVARDIETIAKTLEDIGIYELSSAMVEHVYRINEIEISTSQSVGVELANDRCLVYIGSSCVEEERDIHICEALFRLFSRAIPLHALVVIFTATIRQLDVMYPDSLSRVALLDSQGAAAEDDMSWLDNRQPNAVSSPAAIQQASVAGVMASVAPPKVTLTIEEEIASMLELDIPNLLEVTNAPTVNSGMLSSQLTRTTRDDDDLSESLELMRIPGSAHDSSSQDASVGHRTPLARSRSIAATSVSGVSEYNGILGEIFVYHFLTSNWRLPDFGVDNWTSELRVHGKHSPFTGVSIADFQYQDTEGVLTGHLFGETKRDTWEGSWPTYYLEVKTTSDSPHTPFHISSLQLATAERMTIRGPSDRRSRREVPKEIYVLVRVSSIRSRQPAVQFHPDPWYTLYDGGLYHVSNVQLGLREGTPGVGVL